MYSETHDPPTHQPPILNLNLPLVLNPPNILTPPRLIRSISGKSIRPLWTVLGRSHYGVCVCVVFFVVVVLCLFLFKCLSGYKEQTV